MHLTFMPAHLNVVRFPLERRLPMSLALLRRIAPEVQEVRIVAEAFGLPLPDPTWRDAAEVATTTWLRRQKLSDQATQCQSLLQQRVVRAIEACVEAEQELAAAMRVWVAARAFVAAYRCCEEAEGTAQAIDVAEQSAHKV